jgi:beta-glucosidase
MSPAHFPYQDPARPVDERCADLLARMTLAEKIGQLSQVLATAGHLEPVQDLIRRDQIGSVIMDESSLPANETGKMPNIVAYNALQRTAIESTRLGIPVIHGRDVIHGHRTVFPIPLGMAATWSPEWLERAWTVAAREAASAGVNWTFAPMVDIARDPRWGRVAEGFGEDPYLCARFAAAAVRGFQGDDPAAGDRVLATAKHYLGYGAAEGGRDYNTTEISDNTLRNVYLPPFKAAVDAGVGSVMSAFHDLNGVPMTASHYLLTGLLKDECGFDGFVVSDWNAVAELLRHRVAAGEREAARLAFAAGLDMEMVSACFRRHLLALVESGEVPEERLDDACGRVLAAKFRAGLFERPYADEARAERTLYAPEHQALARQVAARSIVLLQNRGAVLPLSKGAGRIAVIGPYAHQRRALFGSWTLHGLAAETQTIAEAIREAAPQAEAPFVSDALTDEMLRAAIQADVVVLAVGESDWRNGENNSVASLSLPAGQDALIEAVGELGKPLVLIVCAGRPVDLTRAVRTADAILFAWHPGSKGAAALADVLFGDTVPSGKLPISFPRSAGQIPIHYNFKSTGRDNVDVVMRDPSGGGYAPVPRYLDAPSDPLFRFGYGLSYTTFAYSDIEVSPARTPVDGTVTVSVRVENTGTRAGEEVAQCYLQDCVSRATRPARELKGFARVALEPGQAQRVSFELGPDELGYWGPDGRFAVEPGEFRVWAGGDCTAALEACFQVGE